MQVLEHSRSLSCTQIVTQDCKLIGLLLLSSPSFSRLSVCYELWPTVHVNVFNIKCADYFFIKSTFFSPLIHTLSAILLHQPSKYQAIFGASDWLIAHSEKEWNLSHSTHEWDSLGIVSDQLNVFSTLFELKPTRLELNKSHFEIRVNFHSFTFRA